MSDMAAVENMAPGPEVSVSQVEAVIDDKIVKYKIFEVF